MTLLEFVDRYPVGSFFAFCATLVTLVVLAIIAHDTIVAIAFYRQGQKGDDDDT